MKIEIGESLLLSWLRHVKECQIVQTNWKPSSKWDLKNIETLEQLMYESTKVFETKYNYNLYKGNRGISQLLTQAEIDVMGIAYDGKEKSIYAIDVAFHEYGLNYGARDETVARVVKKIIRTAMCIYGYYEFTEGTIIFASPKITPAVMNDLYLCINDIALVLSNLGLNFNIRIIANDDFNDKVLEPVLNVISDVADTSELFVRSLQMYNLFVDKKPKTKTKESKSHDRKKTISDFQLIEYSGIDGLEEMKIGVIVRTVLRKMLEHGEVSRAEIEKMQEKEYSKSTFGIQYPLLQKASVTDGKSPRRYYATPVNIFGEDYFMCSEWFEVPANNDRPYLLNWIASRKSLD